MIASRRAIVELVAAAVAAVGCVLSWVSAQSLVEVEPVTDGEPATMSVAFHAPLLTLALLLAAVAGVFAVLGVASLRRGSPRRGD